MRLRRLVILFVLAPSFFGCESRSPDGSASAQSPPSWAAAPLATGMPLEEMLDTLEHELAAALADDVGEKERMQRLMRAEAITDRLLDSRMPFDWLEAGNYSVGARLRQIQSLADRVAAQIQSRAPRANVLVEARDLERIVRELRVGLAQGGTGAPPSLSELLSADSVTARPPPRQDTTARR
ncbi:MAG: hypothetical protein ACREM1_23145 [Longimicrobiales bacterium]